MKFFYALLLCFVCCVCFAKPDIFSTSIFSEQEDLETDSLETEAAGMEFIDEDEDEGNGAVFSPIVLSDAEYQARLNKMPCVIQLPYNAVVRNYIMLYTGHKIKEKAEDILGLSEYYFPIFEGILDQYGLPLEFKYLPVIESALNPQAVSRAGAVGLWQFMFNTAKIYNVKMTSTVDERRDPIVATHAAARHLKDLHEVFNDWTLVIAAYNCGAGNVRKAMRRSGKNTFWEIYHYLPRETRGYVPAFIGASYMMTYYKEHNLVPKKFNYAGFFDYDTVKISEWVHFEQIAGVTGIPLRDLRDLNPQYRLDVVPGNERTFALKIPSKHLNNYIDNEKQIAQYRTDVYNPVRVVAPSDLAPSSSRAYVPQGKTRIKHTVRSGESLGSIAQKYGVTINYIKQWNGMRRNTIYANQKLNIYVSPSKAQVKTANNALSAAAEGIANPQTQLTPQDGYLCYEVKVGDTLWNITQKYKYLGISLDELKSLNQLSEVRQLNLGQMLKIKKI